MSSASPQPIDASHARERVVDRRGECADRDLDDLHNAEFAVLIQTVVSADPHMVLDRFFESCEAVGRPDTCEWLAAQYKLCRSEEDVNDGVRPQSSNRLAGESRDGTLIALRMPGRL